MKDKITRGTQVRSPRGGGHFSGYFPKGIQKKIYDSMVDVDNEVWIDYIKWLFTKREKILLF